MAIEILSLLDSYFGVVAGDLTWDEYHAVAPALFDQYYSFWSADSRHFSSCSGKDLVERQQVLTVQLNDAAERLQAIGLDTSSLRALLFVGQHQANGHAYRDRSGHYHAWFALEAIPTLLQARVFSVHECIHALHYAATPEFYFTTQNQFHTVGRQLITEGIAAVLTDRALACGLGAAIWADYLDDRAMSLWMTACRTRESEIARFAIDHFDQSLQTPGLFWASDSSDVMNFRAGYYLGYEVINQIMRSKNISADQIVSMEAPRLKSLVLETLRLLSGR